MADKPLKSITFPGLADKYMIPEIDSTLTQQGEAADAKATGDEISDVKNTLTQLETNVGKILPVITGSTNNSGYTINTGDYFEANGSLYKANASIPINGAWSSSAAAQASTAINDLKNSINKGSTQILNSGTVTFSGNVGTVVMVGRPGVGVAGLYVITSWGALALVNASTVLVSYSSGTITVARTGTEGVIDVFWFF